MGRTLKRVPLDFDWPLKKTWGGYLNPFYAQSVDCQVCDRSGLSPQVKLFHDQWYGNAPFDPIAYGAAPLTVDHPAIQDFARRNVERYPGYYGNEAVAVEREARRLFECWRGSWMHQLIQADVDALVAADRLYDFTRVPRTDEQREAVCKKIAAGGNSWLMEPNGYTPTADEVNGWSMRGMGHDAINQSVCVDARCKRERVRQRRCPRCKGEGSVWPSPAIKKQCERWKSTDPPKGDGFQLWETTSEGSPVSPVFRTLDDLCTWAADNATTFGSNRATAAEWRSMLDAEHVFHRDGCMVFM